MSPTTTFFIKMVYSETKSNNCSLLSQRYASLPPNKNIHSIILLYKNISVCWFSLSIRGTKILDSIVELKHEDNQIFNSHSLLFLVSQLCCIQYNSLIDFIGYSKTDFNLQCAVSTVKQNIFRNCLGLVKEVWFKLRINKLPHKGINTQL